MKGSICIVGLGPARPEHLTVEAATTLRKASGHNWRCYGLAHARELALSANPELDIKALDYLYRLDGVSRPLAYADLAQMLCRKAESGFKTLYLVAGSPLFYNDAVLLIRREAKKRNIEPQSCDWNVIPRHRSSRRTLDWPPWSSTVFSMEHRDRQSQSEP